MAKDYAKSFYNSKAWRECSGAYMASKNYICERCGAVAVICHHKKYINERNINNPYITLNFDNLEALCMDCHNLEHQRQGCNVSFDDSGNIESVKESKEVADFKKQQALIDDLLLEMGRRLGYPEKNDATE